MHTVFEIIHKNYLSVETSDLFREELFS